MTFRLGQTSVTPKAANVLRASGIPPETLFAKHLAGDKGSLLADEWQHNVYARLRGDSVTSVFCVAEGQEVWVTTNAQRTQTTLRLPEEPNDA